MSIKPANHCINIPLAQTFRSYINKRICFALQRMCKMITSSVKGVIDFGVTGKVEFDDNYSIIQTTKLKIFSCLHNLLYLEPLADVF
jgi:hypothetical protein